MVAIAAFDDSGFKKLEREIQQATRGKKNLQEAAQTYTALLYEQLKESLILSRVFATVPFASLTPARARFAKDLATANGVGDKLTDDTLVLSLLGTSGVEADWNDPMKSNGHIGIPLVSSAFVEAIPMVSRLLHQMGAGVEWIDRKDTSIVARALGMLGGVFYVQSAASELDAQGRKIIAAQPFVESYGVKSVFGFGGGYAGTQFFLVSINFLRDTIEKPTAERFLGHVNRFKASTMELASGNALFTA
jgi:hypothetical protein